MLSLKKGKPIAEIVGGEFDGEIVYIDPNDAKKEKDKFLEDYDFGRSVEYFKKPSGSGMTTQTQNLLDIGYEDYEYDSDEYDEYDSDSDEYDSEEDLPEIGKKLKLRDGKLKRIIDEDARQVDYIAGPSGSGKTTEAVGLAKDFSEIFPEKQVFIFSRTDPANDPAFKGLNYVNVIIDEELLNDPIDIEKELSSGAMVLFDDVNTIQNDKQKAAVDKLIADILEVGRKLGIYIVVTNHLVIPNEKKMARTMMNELQSLTVFPKSGSSQQIRYALKTYFGLNNKQIDEILELPSRWVTIFKTYPQTVLYESGAYIL